MPGVFIGTVDRIGEQMQQRREQFGFSYYIVSDTMRETFAPVVERLART